MRIVDHKSFNGRREKQRRNKRLGTLVISSSVVAVLLIVFLVRFNKISAPSDEGNTEVSSASSSNVNGISTQRENSLSSAEDFQELYESLAFPNTQSIEQAPAITGNEAADRRIQQIAESRGYQLRSVPVFPIIKTNAPRLAEDDLLQPRAFESWKSLKQAASSASIPLELNSGYRSINMQRRLFVSRLNATGISLSAIANGAADESITKVLSLAAPPGYSRHHTGYTIDLFCNDNSAEFEDSSCFTWLSKDNYANAKQNGWLPSYPDGVDDQGPEPEPWEYVWVGAEIVNE